MEKKKLNVMYGAADEKGDFHIFNCDPRLISGPLSEAPGKVIIEDTFLEVLGPIDKWHPIQLQVAYMEMEDGREFNPNHMADIRNGMLDCHIEDRAKRPVKIIEDFMATSDFPFIGLVCDPQTGKVIEIHNYDERGRCNDGVEEHVLMEKNGKAPGASGDYASGPSSVREASLEASRLRVQQEDERNRADAERRRQEALRKRAEAEAEAARRKAEQEAAAAEAQSAPEPEPAPMTGNLDEDDEDGDGMELGASRTLGESVFGEEEMEI